MASQGFHAAHQIFRVKLYFFAFHVLDAPLARAAAWNQFDGSPDRFSLFGFRLPAKGGEASNLLLCLRGKNAQVLVGQQTHSPHNA